MSTSRMKQILTYLNHKSMTARINGENIQKRIEHRASQRKILHTCRWYVVHIEEVLHD